MDKTYFGKIRTIFIDLDDTIWDFSANSKVAMRIVYEKYGLQDQCPYDDFIACYMPNNESLWTRYHHGEITKEYLKRERFRRSFEQCGIVCNDPLQFDYDYLETIVTLKQVVDGAPELLAHLTKRGPVHVLSNGFANLQSRKLKSGGIDKYITKLILSDDIDVTKPDRRLFDYALEQVGGTPETTVMIGDNYDADILGANKCGGLDSDEADGYYCMVVIPTMQTPSMSDNFFDNASARSERMASFIEQQLSKICSKICTSLPLAVFITSFIDK